jgi:alanine racemase
MTGLTKADVEGRGHPVWAEVDLGAIRSNISTLAALAPHAEIMGVVKGYAYGHGNPASARAMLQAGATRLGVARVAEGIHLREAGIDAPIHVFTEPPLQAAATLVENDLTPSVYTNEFARALSEVATARGTSVAVHLKVDTGMHRVGVLADDAPDAVAFLRSLDAIEIEGVWSHLAVADVLDHPFTRKQLDLFADVVGKIERTEASIRYKHLANSAATISLPESHFDIVRCGVASYGLYPGPGFENLVRLRPALALRARVNMVKVLPAGDAVSYGLKYELANAARVVTVPAGYADGYDRRLSEGADVLLKGRRYKVSGTVCMDQFMVDVGNDEAEVGDVATLLGVDGSDSITAEELARVIGTINYEVAARIPSRVPRIYLNEQADA